MEITENNEKMKLKEFLESDCNLRGIKENQSWISWFREILVGTLKGEDDYYQKRLTGFSGWESELTEELTKFFKPEWVGKYEKNEISFDQFWNFQKETIDKIVFTLFFYAFSSLGIDEE